MNSRDNDEPFLARWARRKQSANRTQQPDSAHTAPPARGTDAPAADQGKEPGSTFPTTEEPFDLSKLPSLEDLTAESDIGAFLDRRVPAALRNAAIKRIWTLDPTIRDFIEVAENQWNWNVPGGAPFYEEMAPGTGAATVFADATSAIVRPLAGDAEPLGDRVEPVSNSENQNKSVDDQTRAEHAAAQPEEIQSSNDLTETTALSADTSAASHANAASQQMPRPETQPVRRRHGGALPT